jgi:hypothetical protein
LLIAPISAHAQTRTGEKDLYLLAETAADIHTGGSGLILYALVSNHELKLVREIVPVPDPTAPAPYGNGLWAVQDDMGDKIYVAYPNIIPSTVSVIHKERPALKDEVDFNPEHLAVLNTDLGVAAGDGRQSYLLCTLLRDIPNYKGPYPGGVFSTLVSVAGDAPAEARRVRVGDWTMFNSFRYQGAPGGPSGSISGYIKDDHVRIVGEAGPGPYTMKLDLDTAPLFPLDTGPGNISQIVAANARYFAFVPLVRLTGNPQNPPTHASPPYVCVHDRKRSTWKRLTSASTEPSTRRIFGSWLTTVVEVWHPGEIVENPGPENAYELNNDLPKRGSTQISIPGTLVLDNLEDGRRVVLETGQQDSEILAVRNDGLVLYRVNDSIFAAQIEGDRLSKPTLVVKDENVPGVHWVFWSPIGSGESK